MPRWDAKDYSRHSAAQQSWARELLVKLQLQGHERVLDIGCGDGKVTAELAGYLPEGSVLGIDSSADMIRFAREAFPRAHQPRLDFEVMDARELDFAERFDVVFSNATLHWIVDHRPVLRGIARALVPGGRAVLQMAGRGNAAAVVRVMESVIAAPRWRDCFEGFGFPYGFHAPAEYVPWLEDAGLEAVRVDLFPKDMAQDGSQGLAGWIRTTWLPYLERVPDDSREALVADVVERYAAAHPADENGRLHVGMVRLEVEARRGVAPTVIS